MPFNTILIDLDGVLYAFAQGVLDSYGINATEDDIKNWDFFKDFDIDGDDFWKNRSTIQFWETLFLYPWAHAFMSLIYKTGLEYYFCTSHGLCTEAPTGKSRAVRRDFNLSPDKIIFTPHKHLLSREGTVLIDDNVNNVHNFNTKGTGVGLLLARPWNVDSKGYRRYTYPGIIEAITNYPDIGINPNG